MLWVGGGGSSEEEEGEVPEMIAGTVPAVAAAAAVRGSTIVRPGNGLRKTGSYGLVFHLD